MFNYLNVHRVAARVPWEPVPSDYRPGWLTRWWARVMTVVLDGYDPWFEKRAKAQRHRQKTQQHLQNYGGGLGDELGPLTLEQHMRRLRRERYR